MNILLIKPFFVGFRDSEIPRVSVFGYFPLDIHPDIIIIIIIIRFGYNNRVIIEAELNETILTMSKKYYYNWNIQKIN